MASIGLAGREGYCISISSYFILCQPSWEYLHPSTQTPKNSHLPHLLRSNISTRPKFSQRHSFMKQGVRGSPHVEHSYTHSCIPKIERKEYHDNHDLCYSSASTFSYSRCCITTDTQHVVICNYVRLSVYAILRYVYPLT